jgi:hypothetical protein
MVVPEARTQGALVSNLDTGATEDAAWGREAWPDDSAGRFRQALLVKSANPHCFPQTGRFRSSARDKYKFSQLPASCNGMNGHKASLERG